MYCWVLTDTVLGHIVTFAVRYECMRCWYMCSVYMLRYHLCVLGTDDMLLRSMISSYALSGTGIEIRALCPCGRGTEYPVPNGVCCYQVPIQWLHPLSQALIVAGSFPTDITQQLSQRLALTLADTASGPD